VASISPATAEKETAGSRDRKKYASAYPAWQGAFSDPFAKQPDRKHRMLPYGRGV